MIEAVLPNGGADAPAEPNAAPIETPVDVPNPVGSQTPAAEKPPEPVVEEKPKTAGDAVRKAMEKVKADQAAKDAEKAKASEPKAEQPKEQVKAAETPKEPEKPAERTPDGKFAAKTPEPAEQQPPQEQEQSQKPAAGIHEAPARFDTAAKAEWANAPESVKGAVHRTIRELEAGIEEHRQRWEPIKKYDDMAKQYQTDLPSALERYVAMDTLLSKDLAQGLDSIIRDKTGGQAGLREFVAHLTGQKPDEAQSRNDATMHELRQEIAGLKQQLSGVSGHVQQQTASSINAHVAAFAADRPDFGALSTGIVEHINAGKSLEAAYEAAKQDADELARSLGYVPAPAQTSQPLSPAPQPAPLKPAGQKSVSGAPATGSDPASSKKAPASSIREALERARSRVA